MKIIAKVSERAETFLVQATKEELMRICHGTTYHPSTLQVGDVCNVHQVYLRLHKLENNKTALSGMAENLRAMATLLESTEPIIRELVDELEPEVTA